MESNYILFSPIGNTDPVSHGRDGAMLHICRHYRPSKVYLFYSYEMCKIRDLDDRYRLAVRDLCDRLGLDITCEEFFERDLEDAHRFDDICERIKRRLDEIHAANPDKTILLNISSGTPAMKGALTLLDNLLPYETLAVQVSSPDDARKNRDEEVMERSKRIREEIHNNLDFESSAPMRAETEEHSNIYTEIVKKDICGHIDAYDYKAALRQLDDIKRHHGKISSHVEVLLNAADLRLNRADSSTLKRYLNDEEKAIVFAKTQNKLVDEIAEYALWMNVKKKCNHIPDFIRGITPILYELSMLYLNRVLGKKMSSVLVDIKHNGNVCGKRFDDAKASDPLYIECMNILGYYDNRRFISSEKLIVLISGMGADPDDVRLFNRLRDFEESTRNRIAHSIPGRKQLEESGDDKIDDVWNALCLLSEEIFGMNDEEFEYYLGSYDRMNAILKKEVMESGK